MRLRHARALAIAIVLLLMFVASRAFPPAFAWMWPILGFHNPSVGYQGHVPTPGTPQWQNFPGPGRAIPVLPGTSYCPINGMLAFGLNPPFGYSPAYPAGNLTNETVPGETYLLKK